MPERDDVDQANSPEQKDTYTRVRMSKDLKRRAEEKAKSRGWHLSSVVRALLELWVVEDVISAEDVGRQNQPAPKRKRKKKKSA